MQRQLRARTLCGTLCALLTACNVGTPFRKPDIALPPAWNAQDDPNGPGRSAVWPAPSWWQGFGSSRLDELIAQAQRNNDDLAGAIARVQEADAQLRIAGAPLLPSVDLGATATRERASINGQSFGMLNVFNPELTASYELDFWGRNRAARDAARAAATASRYDQQTVVVTQVQPISVVFTLPEEELGAVGEALTAGRVKVTTLSRDGGGELDEGTLSLIDNQIDQATGTVKLKVTFDNVHNTLWPGQYVNARVLVRTDLHVLTIPDAAVQLGPNGPFTYVVKSDSTVEVRPLRIQEGGGGLTIVKQGLATGEYVVTSNQYRLQAGVHVRSAAEPGAPAAGAPAAASAGAANRAGKAS